MINQRGLRLGPYLGRVLQKWQKDACYVFLSLMSKEGTVKEVVGYFQS